MTHDEYEIVFTSAATREYKHLEQSTRIRVGEQIEFLARNPFGKQIKKLTTPYPGFRLRVGDYRILFTVEERTIMVYSIAHRKDAYR